MSSGTILRQLRNKKSQLQVANDLNISLSSYSKYERGERTPRPLLMKRIAHYYNVSVSDIFFADGEHK